MALFGNSSGGTATSKNLVEFKCGKLNLGEGNKVKADARKGMFYIHQSPSDQLIHLCWKTREGSNVEDDLIIFPDDCEWKHYKPVTSSRIYVLKFKSSSRRMFFWMQEPNASKDEDLAKKVNDSMNNPPKPGSSGSNRGGGASDLSELLGGNGNLQDLFNNVDQNQLLQLMGGGGGGLGSLLQGGNSMMSSRESRTSSSKTSVATSETPASAAVSAPPTATTTSDDNKKQSSNTEGGKKQIDVSMLQNILSNIQPAQKVDLSKAITAEAMMPILSDPQVQERLKPHLPEGSDALSSLTTELQQTVRSPHFKQAMQSFATAMATGQLGPVLAQFGLPRQAQEAANKGDVEEFAKAMQESSKT